MNSTLLPNWRSALFVPANRPAYIEKAHTRGADAIVLDLEDGVQMPDKHLARERFEPAAKTLAKHSIDVIARINQPWRLAVRDLETVVNQYVGWVLLPKVTGPEHIRFVEQTIAEIEKEKQLHVGNIKLIAYIETLDALAQVEAIAASSSQLVALVFGSEDFAACAGMVPNQQTLYGPCQQMVFACHGNGIVPLGFPDSIRNYTDLTHFTQSIELAKQMGFAGALAIHPDQVTIMNQTFLPTDQELLEAKAILSAFDRALERNEGTASHQGKMIDEPVVQQARSIVKRYESFMK